MSKIKIGAQVTAKVRPTKVTVSGTFQGYRLEDQEDPTSICGTVLHVKDGMQHLDYVYVDSIKVCESEDERIRKRIRLCLDECVHSDIIRDYERDECLAYLEKQKESLHIPETCKENADSFTDVQKPAEWSEKHIADIFEKVGLAKIAREQGNDKLTNALQDAMIELSTVENAEWSEEDSKMCQFCRLWDAYIPKTATEEEKETAIA